MRWLGLTLAAMAGLLAACTQNAPQRFLLSETSCNIEVKGDDEGRSIDLTSEVVEKCRFAAVENLSIPVLKEGNVELKQARIFTIEFDDQGRFYDRRQLEALKAALSKAQKAKNGVSIVTFVHGWRHGAELDDTNFRMARQVVDGTVLVEHAEKDPKYIPREVIGVYLRWRGKSASTFLPISGDPLEVLSFWDRKGTAERVAPTQIQEVLSYLAKYRSIRNAGLKEELPPKVRHLIVGHSFGGLITYEAVAEALIRGITPLDNQDKTECPVLKDEGGADLVVIINAAVEGARYEPLHQTLLTSQRNCGEVLPRFIAITSTGDWATRYAFEIGRFFSTIFEDASPHYPMNTSVLTDASQLARYEQLRAEERGVVRSAIGHVDRYVTHELTVVRNVEGATEKEKAATACVGAGPNDPGCACLGVNSMDRTKFEGAAKAQFDYYSQNGVRERSRLFCLMPVKKVEGKMIRMLRLTNEASKGDYARCADTGGKPAIGCGEGHPEVQARQSPIWVVRTTDEIIDGHNGIDKPELRDFLVQVYHDLVLAKDAKTTR